MNRVCIVEDHPMMRDVLERQASSVSPDVTIAYAGGSLEELRATVESEAVDCVVLDLDLGNDADPEANLEEAIALGFPVLVVSALANPRIIQQAMISGARGYVSKQCEADEFSRALQAVLDRRQYVSPDLAARLAVPHLSLVKLSAQERRALALYASGMKLDAVARTMGVQPGTAKEYIRRVRDKYESIGEHLPSKVDLYRKAHEEGIL